MSVEHEIAFVRAFVETSQQRRLLELLSTKNGRKKFLDRLSHAVKFSNECSRKVPADMQNVPYILELLGNRDAGETCYAISENVLWDKKFLPLDEALRGVVGSNIPTILSCRLGLLAYFEGEERGERYILQHIRDT